MTRNARLVATSALLIAAIAGAGLALASPQQQRPPQQNSSTTTTTAATAVSRPGAGAVVPPPLDRIGVPLTVNECKGLGGKVAGVFTTVCDSGQKCVVAGQNGVIHSACITKE